MPYYKLRPAADGEYVGDSVLSDRSDGPRLLNVTLELDFWRGDCLIAPYPTFFISLPALRDAQELGLSGFRADPVVMDGDLEKYPDMPDFLQFTPTGRPGLDDFAINGRAIDLVLSERAFALLKRHGFEHFRALEEFEPPA